MRRWAGSILGHVPRHLSHLLSHALSWPDGRAAPLQRTNRHGDHDGVRPPPEFIHQHHGVHCRLCPNGVPVQSDLEHPPRSGGRRQSGATTLRGDAETPPAHGNFGKELPIVYRWAYDYSVPGAKEDFIPQNVPGSFGPSREPA
jgi:hypothetical protein